VDLEGVQGSTSAESRPDSKVPNASGLPGMEREGESRVGDGDWWIGKDNRFVGELNGAGSTGSGGDVGRRGGDGGVNSTGPGEGVRGGCKSGNETLPMGMLSYGEASQPFAEDGWVHSDD
jgi:hypothetical protein